MSSLLIGCSRVKRLCEARSLILFDCYGGVQRPLHLLKHGNFPNLSNLYCFGAQLATVIVTIVENFLHCYYCQTRKIDHYCCSLAGQMKIDSFTIVN